MEIENNSWLITGGCGFIGTSLIASLLMENPHTKIRVFDNLSVGSRDDLAEVCNFVELGISPPTSDVSPSLVELVRGDIRDYEICEKCCEGIDIVVHLAANTGVVPSVEDPRGDMEANVIGTFNMLEASRRNGVEKFIFASSGAPIGEVIPPIHEEKAPRPVSPYGASKLAGEGYCSAYYRTFGLKTVALRFGNVYGPRSNRKNSVVAKFFRQALAEETLEIHGDGNQTRDFIFIDDLVTAIRLSVNPMPQFSALDERRAAHGKSPYGEVFQIATNSETTVNEIAEKIKSIVKTETGFTARIRHGETRQGDVRRNYSDISKAKEILGYKPLFTLDDGLEKTFGYFYKGERL